MLKKKFMICALGLCVFGGNAYAHDISVQKLKYDNNQGIATNWSKSDGDATFSLYRVNESDKPMELAAKIEKEGGNKVGEMSITEDGVANFTGLDTGYYVLVETKHSGTHAKPMYFYLDKNVNVYTKNDTDIPKINTPDTPPTTEVQKPITQKEKLLQKLSILANTGLVDKSSYILTIVAGLIITAIYRKRLNEK